MHDDDAARKRHGDDAQHRREGKPEGGDPEPDQRAKEAEEAAEARVIERARKHPARVAILSVLERHAEREALTTRQVREHLDDDPSLATVAYHLLVLLQAKLVSGKRCDGDRGTVGREWKLV